MSLTLSLFAPDPPPPSGGSFDLSFEILSDADTSPTQSLVAPSVVMIRAIAENSAHPLRTVFPSRDLTVFDGTTPELVYDEAYHKVEYYWTITRPAGAATTFDPPGPWGYNMPTAWNNRNKAYGPLVAFCLDEPGAHTITCFAVDRDGNTAEHSVVLTAVDPDVAYAGTLTVAVQPVGDTDETWIPSGATVINTGSTDWSRWSAALPGLYSGGTGIGRRLLLKPGATYDLRAFRHENNYTNPSELFNPPSSSSLRRFYFGVPLGGAQATVRCGERAVYGIFNNRRIASVTFNGISFEGTWDASAEVLRDEATQVTPIGTVRSGTQHNWHKVKVAGLLGVMTAPADAANSNTLIKHRAFFSECFLTDWADYGWFGSNQPTFPGYAQGSFGGPSAAVFLGTKFFRSPDAPQGTRLLPTTYPRATNNRYPLARGAHAEYLYMGASDFGHWTWQQPGFRWYDNDPAWNNQRFPYGRTNIDRCVFESELRIETSSDNGDPAVVPRNTVVDRALVIGQTNAETSLTVRTGSTVRNCAIVVAPGAVVDVFQSAAINRIEGLIRIKPGTSRPDNAFYRAQPSEVYNNTVVILRTPSDNRDRTPVLIEAFGMTVTEWNNVLHMPEFSVNAGPFISDLIAGVTPRALGEVATITRGSINLGTTGVAPGAQFEVPYSVLPDTTTTNRALTGSTNQAYWTANPTHNAHVMYKSGEDFADVSWAGSTANHRLQLIGYTSTGIVFQNNRSTAMTGTWFIHADRRGLRPSPPSSQATPTNLNLEWNPILGSSAYQSATGVTATREFFGETQTPRNKGAF